jgi:DNA primase
MIRTTDPKYNIALSFHEALFDPEDGQEQMEFMSTRPLSKEALETWMVGFCPPHVAYTPFPLLRGRIVVPFCDIYGNILGFAGRKIPNLDQIVLDYFFEEMSATKAFQNFMRWDKAKWINEPYPKSHYLYGLNINKQEIIDKKYIIIVEGNLSTVTLWDHGIRNVVALCGTKFSKHHLAHILRLGIQRIVLMLDGDGPGYTSMLKIVEEASFNDNMRVMQAILWKKDPEDYVRDGKAWILKSKVEEALLDGKQRIELI